MSNAITKEMVEELVAAMKPLPTVLLNPHLSLPLCGDTTLAEDKDAGTLPSNIILSKSVPLLIGYQIDKSLLEFNLPKIEPTPPKHIMFKSRYGLLGGFWVSR